MLGRHRLLHLRDTCTLSEIILSETCTSKESCKQLNNVSLLSNISKFIEKTNDCVNIYSRDLPYV